MIALQFAVASLAAAPTGYGGFLTRYVKNGEVAYSEVTPEDRQTLRAYVDGIGKAKPPKGRHGAMAFYIDAYNALVIEAVLELGVPRSILSDGFFDKRKYAVAGKQLTLNDLEKKVLYPLAKDPRTHMVLVCGAKGCPVIDNRPYTGSDIDKRLDNATRRYLAAAAGARVSKGTLQLSKIFEWYAADFGGERGVLRFVREHLDTAAVQKLGDAPKVSYFEYDWSLNGS